MSEDNLNIKCELISDDEFIGSSEFDFDKIIFDLNSQIDLLSSQADSLVSRLNLENPQCKHWRSIFQFRVMETHLILAEENSTTCGILLTIQQLWD